MLVEKNNDKQITITISSAINSIESVRLIDDITYWKATAKSKAKQAEMAPLADKVNPGWWVKNRKRFV